MLAIQLFDEFPVAYTSKKNTLTPVSSLPVAFTGKRHTTEAPATKTAVPTHNVKDVVQTKGPAIDTTVKEKDHIGKQPQSGPMSRFAPTTMPPTKDILLRTRVQKDKHKPIITCIVNSLLAEDLYVADHINMSIKAFSLTSGHLLSVLSLEVEPLRMASISDCLLPATTEQSFILLIDVSDNHKLRVQKKIVTARRYWGITVDRSRSEDPMLVVSYGHDRVGPPTVDVLTLAGRQVRTVVSSRTLPDLQRPSHLHADALRDVLHVYDHGSHCVFCVQLSTGTLLSRHMHAKLSDPCQVCTDSAGNVYVASICDQSVLVRCVGDVW